MDFSSVLLDDPHQGLWTRAQAHRARAFVPSKAKPSRRSLDFFYLCSYDVDRLREFLRSPGLSETYDIDEPVMEQSLADEVTLMKFGFRLVKQVLFGEATIALKPDALEKRIARRRAAEPPTVTEQPIS